MKSTSSKKRTLPIFPVIFLLHLIATPIPSLFAMEEEEIPEKTSTPPALQIEDLNPDSLREILKNLDFKSLFSSRSVNHLFFNLISDPLFGRELRLNREVSLKDTPVLSARTYLREPHFKERYFFSALRIRFETPLEVLSFIEDPQSAEYRCLELDFSALDSLNFLTAENLSSLKHWMRLEELTIFSGFHDSRAGVFLTHPSWVLNLLRSLPTDSVHLKKLQISQTIRLKNASDRAIHQRREQLSFEELRALSALKSLTCFSSFTRLISPIHNQSEALIEIGAGAMITFQTPKRDQDPSQKSWLEKLDEIRARASVHPLGVFQNTRVRVAIYSHARQAPVLHSPLLNQIHQMGTQKVLQLTQFSHPDALLEQGRWEQERVLDSINPLPFEHLFVDWSED
ncbi:MAG: F-box protein [Bdellovibrionia bacterium]